MMVYKVKLEADHRKAITSYRRTRYVKANSAGVAEKRALSLFFRAKDGFYNVTVRSVKLLGKLW